MDELAFLRQVARAASAADPDALLGAALDAALELTGAARGACLVREADDELRVRARRGAEGEAELGLSRSVVGEVLTRGVPVRLENALEAPQYRGQPSVRGLGLLSVLAVPLRDPARPAAPPFGALYLDSSRVSGIFTPDHEEVLVRFAASVAPQLARGRELERSHARVRELERALEGAEGAILGESPALLRLLDEVRRVAASEAPVLVTGESGTGKELVARALHEGSPRRGGPFVAVNCAALPAELVESELFGHRAGAFTGARGDRAGRFAAADGGTLFLDEVAELPPGAQAALLRALETGELQAVGHDRPLRASVRVVAATHRDLQAGSFREDLYYRLAVVELAVPPLRDRLDDVPLLAGAFLRRYARVEGRAALRLSPAAAAALAAHSWPGNVRELRNAMRRAAIFAGEDGTVATEHLPPAIRGEAQARGQPAAPPTRGPAPGEPAGPPRTRDELEARRAALTEALEREFALAALARAGGNVTRAARETGMHRSVLHRILRAARPDTPDPASG